jgi:hypothetical protein
MTRYCEKQMTRYKALWIGFLLNMVKNAVAMYKQQQKNN